MSIFDNSETAYSFVSAIFFFVLLESIPHIYTGYVGNQFVRIVKNSDLYRNIFLLLSVWFIINYVHETIVPEEIESTWEKIIIALALYVFILLFSRQQAIYNAVELFLLFIMYIIYQVKVDNEASESKILEYVSYGILGVVVIILFIGYYQYMMLKIKQKKKRFTYTKFIFGKREADYGKNLH